MQEGGPTLNRKRKNASLCVTTKKEMRTGAAVPGKSKESSQVGSGADISSTE